MLIKNLTLAVLVFSSTNLFAANHLILMGGSGDPDGASTIFDGTVEALGKNLQASNQWKYQASFNGGHSKTETLLKAGFSRPVAPTTPFTEKSYKDLIRDYKAKINSGEIANGDQLIIIIDSHGAEKSKDEVTHFISVNGEKKSPEKKSGINNYDTLSGSDVVTLDPLAELIKLTNEKGIKLGIVDMSCHSGNTQALKKNAPNTCIVTSTGPVHYGFAGPTTFNGQFLQKLKTGVNLEQAFLEARLASQDNAYPMISTQEGNDISSEVYNSITPYLYYVSPATDKITKYITKNSNDQMICMREAQFTDLISKIDQLQAATSGKKNGYNGEELKRLLVNYKSQQDSMIKTLNKMGSSVADKIETFSAPIVDKKGKSAQPDILKLSWKTIANSDPDSTLSYFKGQLATTKDAGERSEYQAVIANWTKVKAKKAELLSKYPEMSKLDQASKELVTRMGENYQAVFAIAQQEKKFYDELYRKKQGGNSSDPCRQIVF